MIGTIERGLAGIRVLVFWALALVALPSLAAAACEGRDLIAAMQAEEPERYEAVVAAAETVLNGEARFWRVTAPDGGISHLFGTYHDTQALETVTPPVRAAFDDAARIVMEMSPEEMARMETRIATDPAFSFREVPVSAKILLAGIDERQRAIVEQALAARGLTLPVAGRLQPWLLFSLFGVPACQLAEMSQGAQVMDRLMADAAAAEGKPVLGLEGYEEALETFAAMPEDEAILLIRDYLALVPLEEDMRATLLALYAAGRIGMIEAFTEALGEALTPGDPAQAKARNEMLMQSLLNDRNLAWMDRLIPYLEGGGAFVAVGALHLSGEVGLVALLRDAGYTVEVASEAG